MKDYICELRLEKEMIDLQTWKNKNKNKNKIRVILYTMPEKLDNVTFIFFIGLPFILIRHKNRAFRIAPRIRGIWKNWKTFWKRHDSHVTSLPEFFLTRIQNAFSNFSGLVGGGGGNIWCVSRVKSLFLNFSGV